MNSHYDSQHIWHPYSNLKSVSQQFHIDSAKGVYLYQSNGQALIDGMSSWWAVIHGYNHPVLNQAIVDQTQKMSHVMFGGLTHDPAINLAKKLINLTDKSLDYVFFSDSGSVAVEVALKMALQYWIAQGIQKKTKFLTVKNGYHGDTFAAMSVCDPDNGMHHLFTGFLNKNYFADAPICFSEDDKSENSSKTVTNINSIEKLLQRHQDIAAIIIEPLVQGAGGMRLYCPEYLVALKALAEKHHVLLIFDEIATGFGRTGHLFAYEEANVVPDILCLGKALTGGYMSLAATLCNDRVVDGIHSDKQGVLMHGPTFMANPLACAVANASIQLLLSSPWQHNVQLIEKQLIKELMPCLESEHVKDVRIKGAIGIVEMLEPIDTNHLCQQFVALGVWIRPFNHLIYLMPPFIITSDELSQLTSAIATIIKRMEFK